MDHDYRGVITRKQNLRGNAVGCSRAKTEGRNEVRKMTWKFDLHLLMTRRRVQHRGNRTLAVVSVDVTFSSSYVLLRCCVYVSTRSSLVCPAVSSWSESSLAGPSLDLV